MSKQVIIQEGQTMLDIALQEYGCYEGLFLLLQDNNVAMGEDINTGDALTIREVVPQLTDSNLVNMQVYRRNNVSVNTGTDATGGNGYVDEGYVDEEYVD